MIIQNYIKQIENLLNKEKDERAVFLLLRIPLTSVILVSLIVIQL